MVLKPLTGDVEELYRQEGKKMWRTLYAYTHDAEIASDATAEAFARALASWESIRSPRSWTWRVAFRIATAELRARGRAIETEPHGFYEYSVAHHDLVAALGRLSPNQRASVLLHHYAGHPVADVARIIGSTSAAVRVHLSHGRRRLRTLMEVADE